MFEDSSLEFEISMATNIVDNIESILFEAIDYTREKYSTVIEILPSVVRSLSANSKHAVKLFKWNSMLDTFAKEPDFKISFISYKEIYLIRLFNMQLLIYILESFMLHHLFMKMLRFIKNHLKLKLMILSMNLY